MKAKFNYTNPHLLFQGTRFDVIEIEGKRSTGETFKRQIVDHPGAVVIIPFLDENTVVLIRNTREGVCESLLEFPAGTLEPSEDPSHSALRELEEETGYRAKKLLPLASYYSTPGFCNEILHSFAAFDLTLHSQMLDATENIHVETIPLSHLSSLIQTGQIKDAKTICTYFYYLLNK